MAKTIVTAQLFNAVKLLLAGGAKQSEAAQYMKISVPTVARIASAENIEEYKAMTYVSNGNAYAKKKPEENQKPNLLAGNYTLNRLYELMKEQNELLKGISNKLAFVVDELTK